MVHIFFFLSGCFLRFFLWLWCLLERGYVDLITYFWVFSDRKSLVSIFMSKVEPRLFIRRCRLVIRSSQLRSWYWRCEWFALWFQDWLLLGTDQNGWLRRMGHRLLRMHSCCLDAYLLLFFITLGRFVFRRSLCLLLWVWLRGIFIVIGWLLRGWRCSIRGRLICRIGRLWGLWLRCRRESLGRDRLCRRPLGLGSTLFKDLYNCWPIFW